MNLSTPRRLAPIIATMAPIPAFAADMVGPDWTQLVLAIPLMVLYAIGEFALFLVPFFLVMALVTFMLRRMDFALARHVPGAGVFVVFALLAAGPGYLYWTKEGGSTSDFPRPQSVKRIKQPKEPPLEPPVGRSWPRATGYLDLPRAPDGGAGIIRVSARVSFHDTYLKLCPAGMKPCPGLRHAYLRKGDEFAFTGLPAGEYELRYLFISRPSVGGRSRPVRISRYSEEPHELRIDDSPVFDSPRNPIVGLYRKDF